MAEDKEETGAIGEDRDAQILARAQEIRAQRGLSLVEAMILAEEELIAALKGDDLPASFTITLQVKPRVARWILATFGGHAKYTVEERLAAYLVTVMNRSRITAIRRSEPAPEIPKGGEAVTLRREHMASLGL